MFHKPTDIELASMTMFRYMPLWLIPILRRLPGRGMKRLTNFHAIARKTTSEILQREGQALQDGRPQGNDMLSHLCEWLAILVMQLHVE